MPWSRRWCHSVAFWGSLGTAWVLRHGHRLGKAYPVMTLRCAWCAIVCLFLSCTPLAAQETGTALPVPSTWINEKGSTLALHWYDQRTGQLGGSYINHAPGYPCQGTPYPVIGWVAGTAMTFMVKWENATEVCQSLTAWTGFYHQGTITTRWHLVRSGIESTDMIRHGDAIFRPAEQTN